MTALLLAGACDRERSDPPPETSTRERATPSAAEMSSISIAAESDEYRRISRSEAARLLRGARDADTSELDDPGIAFESIPHAGYRGPVGTYNDAAILFANDGEDDPDSLFICLAHPTDAGRNIRRIGPLAGPWQPRRIEDVFFADAGSDGDVDLFVVGRFSTAIDPTRSRRFAATIPYVWRDGRLRYPNRLDDPLGDAPDVDRAADILRRSGLVEHP